MLKLTLAAILSLSIVLFFAGCGINTVTKQTIVTPGLFNDNLNKLQKEFEKLNPGMTKKEVENAGFKLDAKNVECFQGPEAMRYIIGTERNDPGASTPEEIETYANALKPYEACLMPFKKLKSEGDRWFLRKKKSKSKGHDWVFILTFKDGVLFDRRAVKTAKSQTNIEESFGGNVLEDALGGAMSVRRRFR